MHLGFLSGGDRFKHSLIIVSKPNHAVERTASQPTGLAGDGGVWGGWLAVAHFLRWAVTFPGDRSTSQIGDYKRRVA